MGRIRFVDIDLEQEQRQLFIEMVETYRSGSRERGESWHHQRMGGSSLDYLGDRRRSWPNVPEHDLAALSEVGLLGLRCGAGKSRTPIYTIKPGGLRY